MSWMTVFMRAHGLGGLLNTIEAGEAVAKNASPEATQTAVATAVTAVKQAIPGVATTAVQDLGTIAGQVIDSAATKALPPGISNIAVEVTAPLLQELEAVATKWLTGACRAAQVS